MTDLESSFILLSSMSPQCKGAKTTKKSGKSPHKLSLKKHFRKSAAFDKKPHSHHVLDSTVIVLDDSFQSEGREGLSRKNVKVLKAPVIISSTSESGGSSEHSDKKSDSGSESKVVSKYVEIDNWLSENEKLDGYSEVYSFEHHSFADSDEERLKSPKHRALDKTKEGEQPSGSWQIVSIESKLGKEPLRTQLPAKRVEEMTKLERDEDTGDSNFSDDIINESENEIDKSTQNILDNLYGTSWRENKDKMLMKSEPRKPKKHSPIRMPKTERKPSKNIKKNEVNPKSPWAQRLQELCDSDSSDNSVNSSDSCGSPRILNDYCKKLDFSDDDVKIVKKITSTPKYKHDERKCSFLKSLSGGVPISQCNSDAFYYKTNYKAQKTELAKKLFNLYNEKIFDNKIPSDTPLIWNDRMRGSAGFCYNKRITKSDGTVLRSCRIALATKILDTADRLRDTLIHEMCHAATWLVNNVADGHGEYWKSWAYKAMKIFPELPPIKRCHDYQINTKYTYKCTECGYSIGRHSKSLDIERKRCGYCYGKFEVFINKVTKNGEKQCIPATPKGKVTGFALYVKENYGLVKRQNLKHADVMKILGQNFAALKIAQNS